MMEDERDVMRVRLLLGVPWVVGTPVEDAPANPALTLPSPKGGEGSEAEAPANTALTLPSPKGGEGSEAEAPANTTLTLPSPKGGEGSERAVRWVLGLMVTWCAAVLVLVASGAMLPVEGNALAFAVMGVGLVLAALVVVTCPRSGDDDGEVFWTLEREPAVYAQCAPSRVTFTGGER